MATIEIAVPDGMTADDVRRLIGQIAASRAAAARVAAVLAGSASPPGPGVAAQLAAVEALWRHIEADYGTYTARDIATLRGADPEGRSVASRLAKKYRLIAVVRGRSKRYPSFEFKGGAPHPHWLPIVTPLTAAGWDDADILLWLVSPHPGLGGREPAELIDTAKARLVADLAASDARGTW